ncbi:centromere protein L isoform X4 [Dipodomys merriami]|uniref:centromere protein L isoform X4 n=1 Tax=Dipodomys merriami TaxID=94247 RepID=UPI003855F40A
MLCVASGLARPWRTEDAQARLSAGTGHPGTMEPCDSPESTPRQNASSNLKDYFLASTPWQKRLESIRKQTSFVQTTPRRKVPEYSQLQLIHHLEPQHHFWLFPFMWYQEIEPRTSCMLGIKGTPRDSEAFLVQIVSKSQLPSKDREDKVLWTGWFCCIFGDSFLETVSEDFTCLPLFLANGSESNTAIIGTWFQKTFDCYFSRLAINAFNLSWMAAMWTACKMDHYVATTEFLWSVPCSPQSLDISYAVHPEDAKALWDSVHKTPGEVTQEEVDLFMDCLCSHFHRHFKIHLSATRLVRVSTSVASAHTDGKIKILCHKYLIGVLAYLTELAVFQIE